MRAVIDQVQGKYFRCLFENGDVLKVHSSRLPEGIKEGDVLKINFELDAEATARQRELMAASAS